MQEIADYYDKTPDDGRLRAGWGLLEFERTKELIFRHLPPAPARILDVGGGSGVYGEWLSAFGYEVHLIDLAPAHIERARRDSPGLASAEVGDARKLDHAADSVDVVSLLGPLYHLTEREDRLLALREARRVLRPGGWLFAAAICRFAPLLDSLVNGFVDHPDFEPILDGDLRDGQHRNPTGHSNFFTTAYFHRPEEVAEEIAEAGFAGTEVVGVEGCGWLVKDFAERWKNGARREKLLAWVRRVEREPSLLGLSLRLMGSARK